VIQINIIPLTSCKLSKLSAVRQPSVTSKNAAKRKRGDRTGIRRFFGAGEGKDSMFEGNE
jgi:hypothetical protein